MHILFFFFIIILSNKKIMPRKYINAYRKLPLKNTGDIQNLPDGTILVKKTLDFLTVAPNCSHTYPLMGL